MQYSNYYPQNQPMPNKTQSICYPLLSSGDPDGSRTHLHGFADRYVTVPSPGQPPNFIILLIVIPFFGSHTLLLLPSVVYLCCVSHQTGPYCPAFYPDRAGFRPGYYLFISDQCSYGWSENRFGSSCSGLY